MNDAQASRAHAFLKAQLQEAILVAESWGVVVKPGLPDSFDEYELRDQIFIMKRLISLFCERTTFEILRRNDGKTLDEELHSPYPVKRKD